MTTAAQDRKIYRAALTRTLDTEALAAFPIGDCQHLTRIVQNIIVCDGLHLLPEPWIKETFVQEHFQWDYVHIATLLGRCSRLDNDILSRPALSKPDRFGMTALNVLAARGELGQLPPSLQPSEDGLFTHYQTIESVLDTAVIYGTENQLPKLPTKFPERFYTKDDLRSMSRYDLLNEDPQSYSYEQSLAIAKHLRTGRVALSLAWSNFAPNERIELLRVVAAAQALTLSAIDYPEFAADCLAVEANEKTPILQELVRVGKIYLLDPAPFVPLYRETLGILDSIPEGDRENSSDFAVWKKDLASEYVRAGVRQAARKR